MAIIVIRSEEHSANDPEVRDDRRFEGASAIREAIQYLEAYERGTQPTPAPAAEAQEPPFVPDDQLPVVAATPPTGDTSALDAAMAGEPVAASAATADAGGETTGSSTFSSPTGRDEADDVDTAAPVSELEQLLGDQAKGE